MAKKKAGAQLQPTPRPEPPTDDGDVELTPTAPKADTRVSDTVIESEPEVVDLAKIEVVSLLADAFAQLKSSLGSTSQKYHLVVVPTDENARMQTFTDRASLVATLRSLYGTDVQVFVFHGDLLRVTPRPSYLIDGSQSIPLFMNDDADDSIASGDGFLGPPQVHENNDEED